MARDIRLGYEALRSVAFGSITANYTLIGTAFAHPIRILLIANTCNTAMFISFDGTTDAILIPASTTLNFPITANRVDDNGLFLPIGAGPYIKYATAPASGTVYVSAFYGAPNS